MPLAHRTGAYDYWAQEVLRTKSAAEEAERSANLAGYHACVHASVTTEASGLSAGAAVCSAWQFGLTDPLTPIACRPCASRFVAMHWHGVLKGGFLLCSLYLHDGEGMSCRNLDLLQEVGSFLVSLGIPSILGADFQVSPQMLLDIGWPVPVKGRVAATGLPA